MKDRTRPEVQVLAKWSKRLKVHLKLSSRGPLTYTTPFEPQRKMFGGGTASWHANSRDELADTTM
jgi:hypothetical protein